MSHDTMVSLRLSSEVAKEAEDLVPQLKTDPRYRSLPRLSRATVLRLAIDMGLHELRVHLSKAPMLADGFDIDKATD
jgi:hypothetical protein